MGIAVITGGKKQNAQPTRTKEVGLGKPVRKCTPIEQSQNSRQSSCGNKIRIIPAIPAEI